MFHEAIAMFGISGRHAPPVDPAFSLRNLKLDADRFAKHEQGTSAVIFGLMSFAAMTLVGAAVDTTRWLNARSHTIDAIDAAVLAAGRALQTGATEEAARELAREYYLSNTAARAEIIEDTVDFEIRNNRTTVAATGRAFIRTPLLALAHVEKLPLFMASEGSEATTAQDSAASYNREVALMLDVSGSMCSPCTKRDDMQAAARDLVEIMMKNNETSPYWSKIAVVPFSGDVRPPSSLFDAAADPAAPASREFEVTTGSGRKRKTTTYTYSKTPCMAERSGNDKYTDAAPGASKYMMPVYKQNGACTISSTGTILPLTIEKSTVLAKINGLTTGGGTAGHLGTAWSYYMLSPEWSSSLPASSQPSAYGTAKLKKTAILMTDGEYNQEYDANGIDTSDSNGGSSANSATSAQQAVKLCADMKMRGIDVYTVGFDLPNTAAANTLASCASDPSMSYTVATGEQLRAAFRDIAIRTTELHLAK
jgi:Flp pilus assembly protein TadG